LTIIAIVVPIVGVLIFSGLIAFCWKKKRNAGKIRPSQDEEYYSETGNAFPGKAKQIKIAGFFFVDLKYTNHSLEHLSRVDFKVTMYWSRPMEKCAHK